ncbi:uncharacterized protein LOC143428245 [Xylocopa sonorina]|uniref:uncharacterized protein LOC143428245 n=1 Tax=Xylocopa sonorina TaxID=1818115 RepID=UPI00403B30B7
MCDHCRTFKPLLEGAGTARLYEDRPKIIDVPAPPPPPLIPRPRADDAGCCSWRQSCCDGVCCNRIGSCCTSQPEPRYSPPQRPTPSYGYGYGQPAVPGPYTGMTGGAMPDRVACVQREKQQKLPMCFGGDCQDSPECTGKTNSDVGVENESIPRQSER